MQYNAQLKWWLIDRKWICDYFDNQLEVIFQGTMQTILFAPCLKWKELVFFFVLQMKKQTNDGHLFQTINK